MHSECLVCTCFQAPLALSGFFACERVDTQNIAFSRKHFAWLEINSYKLKILEKSSNVSPEKVYEPTLSLTFHVYSIGANHTYNCQ